jgi:hypothetical protein
MKENAIVIELLSEILKETLKLSNEITRIRSKLDTELYKIGTKYELIDNSILVCRNKYKNSIRSFKPKSMPQTQNNQITITFD